MKNLIAIIMISLAIPCYAITWNVYYPKDCKPISGHIEKGHAHGVFQLECMEGEDLSTYVSAPFNSWSSEPIQYKYVPSNINHIYLKEQK